MTKDYFRQYRVIFSKNRKIKESVSTEKEDLSQILSLAIPLLMENALQTFLGTVDRYFASSFADSAVAAIGVTEIVTNLYSSFFIAIYLGVSVAIGKNIGKNDTKQASEVAKQGIILSVILGLITGVVNLVFGRQFLVYTQCTEEILSYALPYYMAVAVPSVFISLSLTLSACLRATKDTKTPMILTSFCNILNIFLNILFVGMGLGIFGIGLATSISRLCLTVALWVALWGKKDGNFLNLRKLKVNQPVMKEIITIGLPVGGEKLAMRIGQLCYTAMILSLGTDAYVAHTLVGTIENYIYIPTFAFATTTSILVSIHLGAGESEKANQVVSLVSKINTLILLGFSVVFVLFGKSLVGIFTDSPQVIWDTYPLMVLLGCAVPFMGILSIYTAALQGTGNTKTPMYVTLFGIWVFRLGGGFLVTQVFGLGIFGFWMVITLDCALRSLCLCAVYREKLPFRRQEFVPYVHK